MDDRWNPDGDELRAEIAKDGLGDLAEDSPVAAERLNTLARRYLEAEERAEIAEQSAKKLRDAADELQREFWDRLDDDATPTVTCDLGEPHGRVQFQRRETIRTRIIDKDAAAAALRAEGHEYMLEPVGFRKQPLNQEVRERLRSGTPLPDGVDFSRTRYITISRR